MIFFPIDQNWNNRTACDSKVRMRTESETGNVNRKKQLLPDNTDTKPSANKTLIYDISLTNF